MASLRLFYFIEKHAVKARDNPMWKDFIRQNKTFLDENPKIVTDLALLVRSTDEYKRLLEIYNIGVHRDMKQQVENVAMRCGLKVR
ncbi:hypothetical protein SteCoe_13264 [Stentor coeruleus]|uniref:Uncharacterized protein n=1 Tax=Stentor coeruleus TaxID=5963 RepID=A0A1R2C8T3_9CILI|nr:hypothetical protein SteCoe_13264 [Stentor coeruleus]